MSCQNQKPIDWKERALDAEWKRDSERLTRLEIEPRERERREGWMRYANSCRDEILRLREQVMQLEARVERLEVDQRSRWAEDKSKRAGLTPAPKRSLVYT